MAQHENKINLAVLSPNQNALSESFIQAHRDIPGVEVKFYYEGSCPVKLNGKDLISYDLTSRLVRKIKNIFSPEDSFSIQESALFSSFKKEKIDCVLAEYGPTGVAVLNVCKKAGIPLIVHFHGYDATVDEVTLRFRNQYSEMFNYASSIISVSTVMTEKLKQLGCPPNKIVYNPYGPNDLFFKISPDYTAPIFIAVGRFVDKKAPYFTILAFSKVANDIPEAKLIFVGDGVLMNTCSNLIKYLKIEEKVIFTGGIKPPALMELFKDARAFVQHSVTALNGDMEGTPVAVLEAGASSLPVISTRHAGISDVVIEGETGLLVEEYDVEGMAENMRRILESKEYAQKLGANARKHILENYSMLRHLKSLGDIVIKSVNLP